MSLSLDLFLDCALDALKDGAMTIPVLFLTYLFMEWLERSSRLNETLLNRSSVKAGPVLGGLLGAIPQCGISGGAATLFSTGAISVGTMLAVFLSTSDEMLPILLTSLSQDDFGLTFGKVLQLVLGKVILGILFGYLADFLLRGRIGNSKNIHGFCEREHCECEEEGNLWLAALMHTLRIALLLIVIGFLLNILLSLPGIETLSDSIFNQPVIGQAILSAIGLIPNCSISVLLTRSYLSGLIGAGGLFAGLLSNAGVGLLVLLRTNRSMKENGLIILTLYGFGLIGGLLVSLL